MTSSQCEHTYNSVFIEHNAHLAMINNGFGLAIILKRNTKQKILSRSKMKVCSLLRHHRSKEHSIIN